MVSFSDLISTQTTDQVEATILSGLETAGLSARSWREGGSLRTIIRVIAGIFAGFLYIAVQFARSGFLELAEGDWLTLLAANVYNVARIEATFAVGQVTLTNSGGGNYPLNPGELRVISAVTGKAYTNTASVVVAPSSTVTVNVQAVEIGSASNAPAGTITKFETTPGLPGVAVTNLSSIVGSDAETDAALRLRCKAKLATISGLGPRGAYEYAVRTATRSDGSLVDINRTAITRSPSTGVVQIYCASPSGVPLSTDLDYVRASVEVIARPDTVTAIVSAATVLPVAMTLTVWASQTAGVLDTDIEAAVQNALLDLVSGYRIGGLPKPPSTLGYLYQSRVEGTVIDAHPSIYDVDGVPADIAMGASDIVSLTATVNVRLVTEV